MEELTSKNYAGEIIPDVSELLKEIAQLTKNLSSLKHYGFFDLFNQIEKNGVNEYYRKEELWRDEIKYNTWDKNAWDELDKPEGERRKMNEVKGLYIFYEDNKPIYIGISRSILKRLKSHFLGKIHNEATLAYIMIRHKHEGAHGFYNGERANLDLFKSDRTLLQKEMMTNWKIAIIPETDNYKMYFFEIYLACHLKTIWNSFETH